MLTCRGGAAAEHWGENVAEFRPSRFIDTDEYKWPRDAYLPFAVGARACIGKQSAIVEATAFLARIVAKYKIEIPAGHEAEWALRPGESEIDRRERIYKVRDCRHLTGLTQLSTDWGFVCSPTTTSRSAARPTCGWRSPRATRRDCGPHGTFC